MNYQTKFVYDKIIADDRIKSVLNIGYRYDSDSTLLNYCKAKNKSWTVLEVFQPNVDSLNGLGVEAFCMNVLDIKKLDRTFDAIIWLHGPEHINWEEFLNVRDDIESKSNVVTIYQTPVGEYPQDEIYGNPYERHVSTLFPDMFKNIGYDVYDHTPEGEKTFSAWKYKK
jgi:hypothetical protein